MPSKEDLRKKQRLVIVEGRESAAKDREYQMIFERVNQYRVEPGEFNIKGFLLEPNDGKAVVHPVLYGASESEGIVLAGNGLKEEYRASEIGQTPQGSKSVVVNWPGGKPVEYIHISDPATLVEIVRNPNYSVNIYFMVKTLQKLELTGMKSLRVRIGEGLVHAGGRLRRNLDNI